MRTGRLLLAATCLHLIFACTGQVSGGPDGQSIPDVDADGDGYCKPAYVDHELCTGAREADCDDGDADVHPGAAERCENAIDDDCDGQTDEGCDCELTDVFRDADGDGYGDPDSSTRSCADETPPGGYVLDASDCDDSDAGVNPGAREQCGNAVDENCNGELELDDTFYRDADGDGFGDPDHPAPGCPGEPPEGHVADDTDCDDGDPARYPGAGGANDCAATWVVSSAADLRDALQNARAGTTILVEPGTYRGAFDVRVSGEEGSPITIRGPADGSADLDGDGQVGDWQGVLTLESVHYITVENLHIHHSDPTQYGVLVGATSQSADGCSFIELRRLHVHDVGEEIIKIQGRNTHDILVESCIVHSNLDWSGIDVQGHWGGTPPYDQKPRRVVIRENLIYDVNSFAGVGNEFADNVQVYDNVVLGCAIGLDIGCGNYNLVANNLVTSYAEYNARKADPGYTAIDLSRFPSFSQAEIDTFGHPHCLDGIALSGNYMSLVFDNEITDCTRNGDMILSYDHWVDGQQHNHDYENGIAYGHRYNIFFRNRIHDNVAYYTIREYNKQEPAVSYDQLYLHNLFADNSSSQGMIFEHSERLVFANNTIAAGDTLSLQESSTGAVIKNMLFFESGCELSADSTGADVGHNVETADAAVFVDRLSGDFHLDAGMAQNPCIQTGEDLDALLAPRFEAFDDLAAEAFGFREDFDVRFDLGVDLAGRVQSGTWDVGAYSVDD
ncbi:MAG: hypothetical protein JXR96_11665 [Deltaproteobacteria bacterium]|nr:hypothetical protein [Deltaproteobacteria bacterium]